MGTEIEINNIFSHFATTQFVNGNFKHYTKLRYHSTKNNMGDLSKYLIKYICKSS
jgi:hypothetical protein